MKLQKIKIEHFRSFNKETTILVDDLNAFIGANSSGKTSALLALCKLFSENSSERIITKNDFFQSKVEENSATSKKLSLSIEAVFETSINPEETPLFFSNYVVDSQGDDPYLRIRLEATWEDDGTVEGAIDSHTYFIICPEDKDITENDKRDVKRNLLNKIRVIYIPALRNPNQQLKNASGSMMYRIINSINWADTTKESIREHLNALNNTISSEKGVLVFREAIQNEWKKIQNDIRYSNAELIFNSDNIESALMKAEIVFKSEKDDKFSTIDEIGDGLRSLFYFSMIESLLDIEEKISKEPEKEKSINMSVPLLTILAVEEPENHIAPHLLGKLINQFKSISGKDNAQVLMSSHSPAIIKRVEPTKIRHFRLDTKIQATKVRKIKLPDKEKNVDQYKFVKEAVRAYPELYFSKLVILGEGDSEELILSKFIELVGSGVDNSEISIVPLGGRFVNHFWRLLKDLQIPYITLLDLDRERFGGGWGRIKYVLNQLLEIEKIKEGELLSKESLETMHTWDTNDIKKMDACISWLEKYDIFFSYPLDIDLMMLEHYSSFYKQTLDRNEGPSVKTEFGNKKIRDIENEIPYSEKYCEKVNEAVSATLKVNGENGNTYSEEQKKLMVWYNYFFLGRGKPTTHIAFFSNIDDEELKKSVPEVIKKIVDRANGLLNKGQEDE